MKANRILTICVLVAAVGCAPPTKPGDKSSEKPQQDSRRSQAELASLPSRITNQFGMTFRLVTIDTSRADHKDSFPKRTYYLQESRLTWAQHSAFRKAAFGDGTYETIAWHYNSGHPSEWHEWSEYTQALSKFDTKYDYRLPSQSEWTFACKSGYDQSCDKAKPNTYGITGLIDTQGYAEAVSDVVDGSKLRVVMGYWKDNWGEHRGETKPKCSCDYWTACNPDADDSLNEIISGRFVLIPKQTVDPAKASGG